MPKAKVTKTNKKKPDLELSVLKDIYSSLDKDKMVFAEKLIDQLLFMQATLTELQGKIKDEGAVIESTNGNGFTTYNEHPAQKSYNTMIKNYNSTIKQLLDLIPEKASSDELLDFIGGK